MDHEFSSRRSAVLAGRKEMRAGSRGPPRSGAPIAEESKRGGKRTPRAGLITLQATESDLPLKRPLLIFVDLTGTGRERCCFSQRII